MGIHRNPRKGTLNAPDVLLENFEFEQTFMIDEVFPDEFNLEKTQQRIETNTEELSKYGKPVLSIGGDHSVSFPVLKALKSRYPELKLVWLDAHLDLKQKVSGHVSHDVVVRALLEHGFSEDDIVFVGITEIDHDERDFLDSHDISVYMADETEAFVEEYMKTEDPIYLSVDIDVLEEKLAPGTGYLHGELKVEDVENIIEKVSPDHADLVEVAPSLDEDGVTFRNARRILKRLGSAVVN
jgi:arginase family enzyme